MLTRIIMLFIAFAAAPAVAAAAQAAPPPATSEDVVPVAIDTSVGRIVIALDRGHAPVTTANFVKYVDLHRFDGEAFYRAMHVADAKGADGGLIQGGITSDSRKLLHSDFFILVSDMPGLDANGPGGDANGFAAFGRVTEGMDVVRKIWSSPVSATKGAGVMKGEMLDPTVRIIKVTRVQ